MKKLVKTNWFWMCSAVILAGILTACSGSGVSNLNGTLKFQTSEGALESAIAINQDVNFNDLRININDIELRTQAEVDANATGNFLIPGPIQIDLLSTANVETKLVGNLVLPPGTYTEIRFKLSCTCLFEDPPINNPLYDRSIYMTGTIEGTPFIMWYNINDQFTFTIPGGVVVTEETDMTDLMVQLNIGSFLDSNQIIDLTTAEDGNQNDIIELGPDSTDGQINQTLALELVYNIMNATNAFFSQSQQ